MGAIRMLVRATIGLMAIVGIVCSPLSAAPASPVPTAEPTHAVPAAVPSPAPAGQIDLPAQDARVTLPIHLLARVGQPGESVSVDLRWEDGTELSGEHPVLRGEDGRGLVIGNVDWGVTGQRPPQPPTQPAVLEIRGSGGTVLARQSVLVLAPDDPDVQMVTLYWVKGETLQPEQRPIPRTEAIATAAIEELLWGPSPERLPGYYTELPTPEQVLSYLGREPDWGPRVTLRGLTIHDGVATADFSKEISAYGGGSTRVMFISQQVRQTLLQFPTVQEVEIAIEGEVEGVLQP